jgi:DAACS family dicarboxylate/amino acid:cation (Na+ or H+) symporter
VILALLFGFALRRLRDDPRIQSVKDFLDIGLRTLIVILHWVVDLLPFAVLAIVADLIGTQGFASFKALGWFVIAVLVALTLQVMFYLTRIRLGSWCRPWQVLIGMRDALFMAFSTASSTVTMPVTYDRLQTRVGVRQESASMGAMVGANFNNDGTALYEAMAALFVSQLLAIPLTLLQQGQVVLLAVIASVGAAGIPEAGLVTMVLVFKTVGLPPEYIGMLLPIDWFLDRCRTAVNVMGDVTVSCVLDGRTRGGGWQPPTTE